MTGTVKLKVALRFGEDEKAVGDLVSDGRKIYFRYDTRFLESGLEISPLRLPLEAGIKSPDTRIFEGLFGVFNDSLPDGWGRRLLDMAMAGRGIPIHQITALDRLAYVGTEGMGALVYYPEFEKEPDRSQQFDLDHIAAEMNKVLEGTSSEIIEALYDLGGSSGGARPKILVGYNPLTDQIIFGHNDLPEGFEHWLIKFPASSDLADAANVEYAYHKMALSAGIEMSECRLFRGASGKHYFGTKRFDRSGNERLHMHSAAGLIHDDFRVSANMDYGHLMDVAFTLERHVGAYEKILRLAAFNVYGHNRDDHSKNFAFLMDQTGSWKFAPAYDLIYSRSSHGSQSTSVAGEYLRPGNKQLLELAHIFSVKHPERIIEQVKDALSNWQQVAADCGVGKQSQSLVQRAIDNMKD